MKFSFLHVRANQEVLEFLYGLQCDIGLNHIHGIHRITQQTGHGHTPE